MRLTIGILIDFIVKNKVNYKRKWFCNKKFENKLYHFLQVKKWKNYLPTYTPDAFDISKKNICEIVEAPCQAEIIHEIIMVFSLLPIVLIPFLGGNIAIILTSIFAMLFDSLFVIIQRYNRPRIIKLIERYEKRTNK